MEGYVKFTTNILKGEDVLEAIFVFNEQVLIGIYEVLNHFICASFYCGVCGHSYMIILEFNEKHILTAIRHNFY